MEKDSQGRESLSTNYPQNVENSWKTVQKKGLTGASFVRIMKNDVLQAISDKVEKICQL